MRSWSSLAGLLLSLAGHGALLLVLAWVWVGESPPVAALMVDLEAADASEPGARVAGDAGAAGEAARETPPPAVRERTRRGAGLRGPASPPAAALPALALPPPVALGAPPPPSPALASPLPALAAEPDPVPIAPPSPVPPTSRSPDTPRPLPPPASPAATPPPVAMLDVPRDAPGVRPGAAGSGPGEVPALTVPRGHGPTRLARERGEGAATGEKAGVAGEPPAGGGRHGAGEGGSGATSDASGVDPSAGGGPLALAVPGNGFGAPAGAEYHAYYEGIRRLIRDSLRYPSAARRRGLSGTVELELEVRPSGTVGSVAVVRSSSHRVLDDAALEAARALPRMPFPPGVRPRALRVRIPVDFELR